jgi:hypothetical protein
MLGKGPQTLLVIYLPNPLMESVSLFCQRSARLRPHGIHATLRCKFFTWLAVQKMIWTSNCRAKLWLPHNGRLSSTLPQLKILTILLTGCSTSTSNIIWCRVLGWDNLLAVAPSIDTTFMDWWSLARISAPCAENKKLNNLVSLVTWSIWKEHNKRVFENMASSLDHVVNQIKCDA